MAPVGAHHKRGDGIREEYQDHPLEYVGDLTILEPHRCPRNEKSKCYHEPMGVDSAKHRCSIGHSGKVCRNVYRVCAQESEDEGEQQPSWKSLAQIPSQEIPRNLANTCAHHLNR